MIIRDRTLWIACAAAGLGVMVIVVLIMPLFPADSAGDIQGYGSPVYAFEFARSPADVAAVFGSSDDPERARRLAMMDQGNRWDFLFMTIYTLFGALFGWAVQKGGGAIGYSIIAAAIVAGLADAIETVTLLSITADMRVGVDQPAGLGILYLPVFTKFFAMSASIIAAGLYLARREAWSWRIVSICGLMVGNAAIVFTLFHGQLGRYIGIMIGIGWIIMLAYALTRSARPLTPPPR